jgi:hypothetical protein
MGVVYKALTPPDRFVATSCCHPTKLPTRNGSAARPGSKGEFAQPPEYHTIADITAEAWRRFHRHGIGAGQNADQLIPARGMRLNEALNYVQIADAMAAAHAAGIVHRDLARQRNGH